MPDTKQGLFVSISFPPKKDPECIQTSRLFKYLGNRNETNFTIITSKEPTLNMPHDPSLEVYDYGYKKKIEVRLFENKYIFFLIRKVFPRLLEFPDGKFFFHLQWKKVIKRIKTKPDFIYSRSYPLSSAILALKLKDHFNVPWIMHLSDPWADSPIHNWSDKIKRQHNQLEKACFTKADKISFTSEKTLEFYLKKYSVFKHKFFLNYNMYDDSDILQNNHIKKGSKFKITYTGGLAGKRSPLPIINALKLLLQYEPSIDKNIQFIIAGPLDRQNKKILEDNSLSIVKYYGEVSLKGAQELQLSSHILICIDTPINKSDMNMFFPSKLLDYFISQRKIIGITSRNSTTSKVLNEMGHISFDYSDEKKLAMYLKNAYKEWSLNNLKYFKVDKVPHQYSARNNAQQLIQHIKSFK